MNDKNNIPEISADDLPYADAEVGDKGNLEDLDNIDIKAPEKDIVDIATPKDKPLKRIFRSLKKVAKGENSVGKKIGHGLDIVGVFVPGVDKIRGSVKGILGMDKSKQTDKPMLSKILSIKNFINLKDEDENFSLQELGASLLQIVLAGAVVWAAMELGIWEQLIEVLPE